MVKGFISSSHSVQCPNGSIILPLDPAKFRDCVNFRPLALLGVEIECGGDSISLILSPFLGFDLSVHTVMSLQSLQ